MIKQDKNGSYCTFCGSRLIVRKVGFDKSFTEYCGSCEVKKNEAIKFLDKYEKNAWEEAWGDD